MGGVAALPQVDSDALTGCSPFTSGADSAALHSIIGAPVNARSSLIMSVVTCDYQGARQADGELGTGHTTASWGGERKKCPSTKTGQRVLLALTEDRPRRACCGRRDTDRRVAAATVAHSILGDTATPGQEPGEWPLALRWRR